MNPTPHPLAERLESRQMFSVTAALTAGTLVVNGDNNANDLRVEQQAGSLHVQKKVAGQGYQDVYTVASSSVTGLKIYARGGNDRVTVGDGVTQDALIVAGAGADWVKAGAGATVAWGHSDTDIASDDNAVDTFVAGAGSDQFNGQGGDDVFQTAYQGHIYNAGWRHFYGGGGNDKFYLDDNRDTDVHGGVGNDTCYYRGTAKASYFGDGGTDTIDMSSSPWATVIDLTGRSGSGPLSIDSGRIVVNTDVENANGSKFAHNTIFGNDANNRLIGGDFGNEIYGGDGNDRLEGGAEMDYLDGGHGSDTLYGFGQTDTLKAGDTVSGQVDTLYGGDSKDYLYGSNGNDRLFGEAGDDTIVGGMGNDLIVGGSGVDYLDARDAVGGNDVVFGGNLDGSSTSDYDRAYLDKKQYLIDIVTGVDEVHFIG